LSRTKRDANCQGLNEMPHNEAMPIKIVSRRLAKHELEYDFTKQVGHLLRKAYQAHIAIFQQMCADPQLTAAQLAVLCALHDKGSSSLTEIGSTVVMDPATVRGIVERLMERKLISLVTDKHDRRRVIANLTKKGQQLLSNVIPSALAISDHTMRALNSAERVALLHLLNKISGAVSETEKTADARPLSVGAR
jgi:MarR family transcriptional regulator, lower aerobic nicotinate degradation pathway regulator